VRPSVSGPEKVADLLHRCRRFRRLSELLELAWPHRYSSCPFCCLFICVICVICGSRILRGDRNGGPGYQIRDEINLRKYETGTVGMALSGKDTGGSQFFITHSPQPHLDGGYTVFGRVLEGMDVVNRIARGDRMERVEIIEPK
jgi:cyclophilin family peptidyl-prolyl cis-trans isomerase